MRTWIWMAALSLLAAATLVPALAGDGENSCDMKTIVKMRYCTNEDRLLEKDELVNDKTYYQCPECDAPAEKGGKCTECGEGERVEKKSGKNACAHCFGETTEVEACEKTYFECPTCGEAFAKEGKCPDDEVALEKKTSHALILYVCPGCGTTEMKPGKCTDTTCEHQGEALVKTCAESGYPPHVR